RRVLRMPQTRTLTSLTMLACLVACQGNPTKPAPKASSEAKAPASVAPAVVLQAPAKGTHVLAGSVQVDARYATQCAHAQLIASGGGNVVQFGSGQFIASGGGNVVVPQSELHEPGAVVIGSDGAALIGADSAGVIGNNSAGVIGNNSSGVIGSN